MFLSFWLSITIPVDNYTVNSAHKGQWRGASMFSLICAWINSWFNNRECGDLRSNRAHYDVTEMAFSNSRWISSAPEYIANAISARWLYCIRLAAMRRSQDLMCTPSIEHCVLKIQWMHGKIDWVSKIWRLSIFLWFQFQCGCCMKSFQSYLTLTNENKYLNTISIYEIYPKYIYNFKIKAFV